MWVGSSEIVDGPVELNKLALGLQCQLIAVNLMFLPIEVLVSLGCVKAHSPRGRVVPWMSTLPCRITLEDWKTAENFAVEVSKVR